MLPGSAAELGGHSSPVELHVTRHKYFLIVETGRPTSHKRSMFICSTCLGNVLILVCQREVMGLDGIVSSMWQPGAKARDVVLTTSARAPYP
jgi:hypothetical protein